jgi:hypothetical protein
MRLRVLTTTETQKLGIGSFLLRRNIKFISSSGGKRKYFPV